jgi:Meckel syndrome type 1 protein
VKQRWIVAALWVLAFSAPAAAADPLRLAQAVEAGVLPPHEIITIVRSTRLDPIGRPVLRGPNYVVRALDETDREMRVIVSARRGEILRIVPVQTASRMPPPGGGYAAEPYERMERYERVAPGPRYVAPEGYRYGSRPPVIDDDDDDLPYEQQAPRPPGNLPGAASRPGTAPPPRTGYADPPPVIRSTPPASGPGIARGTDLPPPSSGALPPPSGARTVTTAPPRGASPSQQSASRDVYTPEPDREGGMLPPPPERFPQRVAPAPEKPKPVKREASSAAPKAAPLPKPKPATPVSATAPKPAAPATAPAASAPAAPPPAAETKTEAPKPQPLPEQKPAVEQKPADGGVPH